MNPSPTPHRGMPAPRPGCRLRIRTGPGGRQSATEPCPRDDPVARGSHAPRPAPPEWRRPASADTRSPCVTLSISITVGLELHDLAIMQDGLYFQQIWIRAVIEL